MNIEDTITPRANIPHSLFSHHLRKKNESTNFSVRPEHTEFSCNTAHDCNVAFLPLQHMREHLLSKGENSENIQFNHLPVNIQRGFFKQCTLRPACVVYKNVNLEGKLHEYMYVIKIYRYTICVQIFTNDKLTKNIQCQNLHIKNALSYI